MVSGPRNPGQFLRGLRFRLAASSVVFFSLLLVALGLVFREALAFALASRTREVLDEEWAAVKGYLRIERGRLHWQFDREDPEEAAIVERLRRVLLVTDASGTVLEISNAYRALGPESPEEIRAALQSGVAVHRLREDDYGEKYMVRSGLLIDGGKRYYLALMRRIEDNQAIMDGFSRNYFVSLPVIILLSSFLSWLVAGRALRPVNEVSRAARRISGANLKIRLEPRHAGDELDDLIEAFNNMLQRLEASFEQIRQFSTDVSHELRTPLTSIRGQLEVALFTAQTADQYREAMLNSLEDVERLSQVVRALLLLSQAESGQLALQMEAVDLARVVGGIAEQFQVAAEDAGVALTTLLPPSCIVRGDRVQLERLVSNLLSNAVKYTPAGGRIEVTLHGAGERVELAVKDSGIGIPESAIPHIFDRFYRVQTAGQGPEKGLGLGLSFVAWIVRAHGGDVRVDSQLNEGSTFTVSLPAAGPEPTPAQPGKPALQ